VKRLFYLLHFGLNRPGHGEALASRHAVWNPHEHLMLLVQVNAFACCDQSAVFLLAHVPAKNLNLKLAAAQKPTLVRRKLS
jgi:hypothetical protein